MKTVNKTNVHDYLQKNARPLDLALYDFHFNSGDSKTVLSELANYQNDDGGFGNAIEPDLQMPHSSAIASSVAFQYLVEVGATAEEPMVQSGIRYFLRSYDNELTGWRIIRPEADRYPHAPWWDYGYNLSKIDWGNPSAEILGYLIKYSPLVSDDSLIETISQKVIHRLRKIDEPEFHEIINFIRLYDMADTAFRSEIFDLLSGLIKKAADEVPDNWSAYTATPLTFIRKPQGPFARLFDKDLLDENIRHINKSMIDGDHWEPNWDWADNYPEAWLKAKQEWSGKMTVDNMILLRNFGKI